jgi:hypothetical protein
MASLWKALGDNQTLVVRLVRAVVALLGALGAQHGWWPAGVGNGALAAALLMGAGEKNPTPVKPA